MASHVPALVQILTKITPSIGATIITDDEWHIAGQITFKNGARRYFKNCSFDLNPFGAAAIALDKDYANFFMRQMGYPIVPDSKSFFSDEWGRTINVTNRNIDAAYQYAVQLGFPVIVKPNSGSLGEGVAKVHGKEQFYAAMEAIFAQDRVGLVQPVVPGQDYRVVVLDDRVVAAYQRVPLNVVGDGHQSMIGLLEAKWAEFASQGRRVKLDWSDSRMTDRLQFQNLSFDSVPDKGRQVFLLDNANLSSGGDAVDVSKTIHEQFKQVTISLTRDMGLRLCGVDIMVNGPITEAPREWWVLEINASPGLDHYAKGGPQQQKIVEKLYLDVIKAMEKEAR